MSKTVFILTDCAKKKHPTIPDGLSVVKIDSLTQEELIADYVPFCDGAKIGAKGDDGKIYKKIEGDENSLIASGVIMVGKFARPFSDKYSVGGTISAPMLYDGDTDKPISPTITSIIIAKDENDTDEIVNAFNVLCSKWKRHLNMAENTENYSAEDTLCLCYECAAPIFNAESNCSSCGSWDWDDTDFFGAEYESYMQKIAFNLAPNNKMYNSTVE